MGKFHPATIPAINRHISTVEKFTAEIVHHGPTWNSRDVAVYNRYLSLLYAKLILIIDSAA